MPIKLLIEGKEADVYVYLNPRGDPLAFDFIQLLNDKDQLKIVRLLHDFAERGEIRNSEKFRLEEKQIFVFKSYQTRILCFYLPKAVKRTVVLTHGFIKKKDKIPRSELEQAKNIYKEIVR